MIKDNLRETLSDFIFDFVFSKLDVSNKKTLHNDVDDNKIKKKHERINLPYGTLNIFFLLRKCI
jgi:hypothetical protein